MFASAVGFTTQDFLACLRCTAVSLLDTSHAAAPLSSAEHQCSQNLYAFMAGVAFEQLLREIENKILSAKSEFFFFNILFRNSV
jgi:hypothetical protein